MDVFCAFLQRKVALDILMSSDGRFFVAKQHFTKGETFIKNIAIKSGKMDKKEPLPVNQSLKGLAGNGRRNQTPEERKVWYDYLNKVKPRFHRQRVIGNYIVDFYSPKLKIIIEIDGYQHYYEENKEYDKKRTEYLESLGFVVIRFDNTEVKKRFPWVVNELMAFCENRAKELSITDYNFIVED